MSPLMLSLIRNTRKAIWEAYTREGSDMDMNAPFIAGFLTGDAPNSPPGDRRRLAEWHTISAAAFMAMTAHLGNIS